MKSHIGMKKADFSTESINILVILELRSYFGINLVSLEYLRPNEFKNMNKNGYLKLDIFIRLDAVYSTIDTFCQL